MPNKHPNTVRWGGPGASHEDRTKPMPDPAPAHPEGAVSTNPRVSQVSGGGGERDEKHSHVDSMRSSKSHATDTPSPTSSRAYRQNRSRNDREADMAAREAIGEPRSFGEGQPDYATSPDAPDAGHGTPVRVTLEGEIPGGAVAATEAEQRARKAFARYDADVSDVQIYLSEESGQRAPTKRTCTIQATLHRGDPISVTGTANVMADASMAACQELARRLGEAVGRDAGDSGSPDQAAPQA